MLLAVKILQDNDVTITAKEIENTTEHIKIVDQVRPDYFRIRGILKRSKLGRELSFVYPLSLQLVSLLI